MPARNTVSATISTTGFIPSTVSSFNEVRIPIAEMASTRANLQVRQLI